MEERLSTCLYGQAPMRGPRARSAEPHVSAASAGTRHYAPGATSTEMLVGAPRAPTAVAATTPPALRLFQDACNVLQSPPPGKTRRSPAPLFTEAELAVPLHAPHHEQPSQRPWQRRPTVVYRRHGHRPAHGRSANGDSVECEGMEESFSSHCSSGSATPRSPSRVAVAAPQSDGLHIRRSSEVVRESGCSDSIDAAPGVPSRVDSDVRRAACGDVDAGPPRVCLTRELSPPGPQARTRSIEGAQVWRSPREYGNACPACVAQLPNLALGCHAVDTCGPVSVSRVDPIASAAAPAGDAANFIASRAATRSFSASLTNAPIPSTTPLKPSPPHAGLPTRCSPACGGDEGVNLLDLLRVAVESGGEGGAAGGRTSCAHRAKVDADAAPPEESRDAAFRRNCGWAPRVELGSEHHDDGCNDDVLAWSASTAHARKRRSSRLRSAFSSASAHEPTRDTMTSTTSSLTEARDSTERHPGARRGHSGSFLLGGGGGDSNHTDSYASDEAVFVIPSLVLAPPGAGLGRVSDPAPGPAPAAAAAAAASASAATGLADSLRRFVSHPSSPAMRSFSQSSSVFVNTQLRAEPADLAVASLGPASLRSRSDVSDTPLLHSFRSVLSPCPSITAPAFSVVPCSATSRVSSPVSAPAKVVQQRWRDQVRARSGASVSMPDSAGGTSPVSGVPTGAAVLEGVAGRRGAAAEFPSSPGSGIYAQEHPQSQPPHHRPASTAVGPTWKRLHTGPASAGDGGGGGGDVTLEPWEPLGSGRFAAQLSAVAEAADASSSAIAPTTATAVTCAVSRGASLGAAAKPVIALSRPAALRRGSGLALGTTTAADHTGTAAAGGGGGGRAASSSTSPQLTESPAATSSARWPASSTTATTVVQSPGGSVQSGGSETARGPRASSARFDGAPTLTHWPVTPAEAAAGSTVSAFALPRRPHSQPQLDTACSGAASPPVRVRPWSGAAVVDSPVTASVPPPRVRLQSAPLMPLPSSSADAPLRRVGNGGPGGSCSSSHVAELEASASRCSTPPLADSVAAAATAAVRRTSPSVWVGESISQRISQRLSPSRWEDSTRGSTGSFIFQRQTSRGSPLTLPTAAPRPASALHSSQSRPFTHAPAATAAAPAAGRARACSISSTSAFAEGAPPPVSATAPETCGQEGEPGWCFGVEQELCGLPPYSALPSLGPAAAPTTGRPRLSGSFPALPHAWNSAPRASDVGFGEEDGVDVGSAAKYVAAALQLVPPPPLVALASSASLAPVAGEGDRGEENSSDVDGGAFSPTAAHAQTTSTPPGSARTRAFAPSAAAAVVVQPPRTASRTGGVADAVEGRSVSWPSSSWASPDTSDLPGPEAMLAAALAMSGAEVARSSRSIWKVAEQDSVRTELLSALLDPPLEAHPAPVWMSPTLQASPSWDVPALEAFTGPAALGVAAAALSPASRFQYAFSSLRGCRSRQEDNVMILPALPVRTGGDETAPSAAGSESTADGHAAHEADAGLVDATDALDASELMFSCFGVFDGHCGDTVASLAAQHFPEHFEHVVRAYHDQWRHEQSDDDGSSQPDTPCAHNSGLQRSEAASLPAQTPAAVEFQRVVSAALVQALVHLDLTLFDLLHDAAYGRGTQRRDAGSTASVAAFYKLPVTRADACGEARGCAETYRLCIANLGDSRAIVGSLETGEVLLSTTDHRIGSYPAERARILAAGGVVELGRLDGSLDVTRGLGDYRYKVAPAQWWSSATATAVATAASSSPTAPLCEVHAAATITVAAAARRSASRQPAASCARDAWQVSQLNSRGSTPSGECGATAAAARALCWQSATSSPRGPSLDADGAGDGDDDGGGSPEATHAPHSQEPTHTAALDDAGRAGSGLTVETRPQRAPFSASFPSSPLTAQDPAASPQVTALTGNAVSNVADVYEWEVRRGDVLVMASDGVWDRMSAEAVLAFVAAELKTSATTTAAAAGALSCVTGAAAGHADTLSELGAALDCTPHRQRSPEARSARKCTAARCGPSAALCTPGSGGEDGGGLDMPGAADAAHSFAVQAVARRLTEHVVNELSGGDNTTVVMVVFD